MNCPDLLGSELKEAEIVLKTKYPDIRYNIVYYDSPKRNTYINKSDKIGRVIRQRYKNGMLEIIVSFFIDSPY